MFWPDFRLIESGCLMAKIHFFVLSIDIALCDDSFANSVLNDEFGPLNSALVS